MNLLEFAPVLTAVPSDARETLLKHCGIDVVAVDHNVPPGNDFHEASESMRKHKQKSG